MTKASIAMLGNPVPIGSQCLPPSVVLYNGPLALAPAKPIKAVIESLLSASIQAGVSPGKPLESARIHLGISSAPSDVFTVVLQITLPPLRIPAAHIIGLPFASRGP